MIKQFPFFLGFFGVIFSAGELFADTAKLSDTNVSGIVDYVIDGDTFSARVLLKEDVQVSVRVRILGIDAPELNGECESERNLANQAKKRLAELLPSETFINLKNVKDDKYLGRIDAVVLNANKVDIGKLLLSEGLARKYDGGARGGWCD